jgi:hypothetical protein
LSMSFDVAFDVTQPAAMDFHGRPRMGASKSAHGRGKQLS